MNYTIGDTVNYKTLDMEYYSRGYGISYETGTSKIRSLRYRLKNNLTISQGDIVEQTGDTVKYKTLDMENYSRGYGICYEMGSSTIDEILYILENGYEITGKNILPSES